MRIPFTQVDAFAEEAFAGNPAAVMPLTKWLDDDTLLRIAVENNLSETAFLVPDASGATDYELRWFTPGAEVALCGHATLASGHVVLSSDTDRASVRFATRQAGVLEVARDGHRYAMALPAWAPHAKPLPEIVAGLELPDGAVQETLWHDKGYALVVVENEHQVRDCARSPRSARTSSSSLRLARQPTSSAASSSPRSTSTRIRLRAARTR
jgi:PhzF family phenazine biosynthesis protein